MVLLSAQQQFVHVYTGSSWILSLPNVECACVTAICFQVTKKCLTKNLEKITQNFKLWHFFQWWKQASIWKKKIESNWCSYRKISVFFSHLQLCHSWILKNRISQFLPVKLMQNWGHNVWPSTFNWELERWPGLFDTFIKLQVI